MRFKSFSLERYGHFTDQPPINFDGGSDFHIIVGRNEAGKSTLLNGIRDVLFEIDARSSFNFLHDYKDLRLSAEIVSSSGGALSFTRRKGTKNTLLDAAGEALPDDALRAFLGPVDKKFFETMFGLDSESLREGGRELLAAGGESSGSLFGAASGLASSLAALTALEERASGLFTPRKVASKPFYAALGLRKEARDALRDATITTAEWQRIVDEHKEVAGRVQTLEADLRSREAEVAKANRAIRVRPIILAIRQAREALAALADVPTIATASFREHETASQERDEAQRDLLRIETERAAFQAQFDALNISDDLLALAEDIDGLRDSRGRIVAARNDMPKREGVLQSLTTRVEELVKDLGASVDVDAAAALVPPKTAISQVRSLITDDAQIRTSLDAARDEQAAAKQELVTATEDLAALASEDGDGGLEAIVAAIREPGNLDTLLRDATAQVATAEREVNAALAQLPLWEGTVEELAASAVPVSETVTRFEDDFAEAESELKAVVASLQSNAEKGGKLQRDLDSLTAGENIPTPAAIGEARHRRDELWQNIRGFYVESPATVDEAALAALAPKSQIPEVFEKSIANADDLADRKEAEAARIAQLTNLQTELKNGASSQEELAAAESVLNERIKTLRTEWAAIWALVVAQPLPPREMTAWLAQRQRVVELHQAQAAADQKRSELEAEREGAIARLRESLPIEPIETDTVTELLAKADAVIKAVREAKAHRGALEAKKKAANDVLAKRTRAIDEATERSAAWTELWTAAMATIGQSADQRPDAANVALELHKELGAVLAERSHETDRMTAMHRDEKAFGSAVVALSARIGREAVGRDCVELFGAFSTECEETKVAATERKTFKAQLTKLDTEKQKQESRRESAEATLAKLCAEAGVESDGLLIAVYEAAKERDEFNAAIETRDQELLEAGDGLTFDQLAEEIDATAPEADRALVAATAETLATLNTDLVDAKGRLREVAVSMREIESGTDAELHAERAEGALAELRDVTEEYALCRAAHVLLSSAIDSVRQSKQGPIVEAASELFRRVTGGSYERLAIEFDESDEPVLQGVRPSGERVGVTGMSEGTRDQLFLALRLALVQRYVRDAEPLPFVADDLLVNFDDERAGEALRVLHALSKETQVMLYTHHPHLVEVAAATLGEGGFVRHELA